MARIFGTNIDLNGNQLLNFLVQLLSSDPGSPAAGRVWYRSDTGTIKFRDGANNATRTLGRLDQIDAPTAAVGLGSQRITSLADPTGAQDAATKAYVDATVAGIDWKASVRAATTANVTLAGGAPTTIDGVTLVANDRVLVKAQTAGAENGIYKVSTLGTGANGTWTRDTDADTSAEVTSGMAVPVNEGTVAADTVWILTTNDPLTLGTTALTFTKAFTAGATITKFSQTFGDGAATSYNIDHNLGTTDVQVQVYQVSDGAQIEPDITRTTTNRVVLAFAVAPTLNQYRAVVVG
jgi:hypothetical protein